MVPCLTPATERSAVATSTFRADRSVRLREFQRSCTRAFLRACASVVLAASLRRAAAHGARGRRRRCDAALDAIAAYAPAAMREQGTPGLSIAITDRTQTLRIITLGYANRETRAPVTPQTRFAIGSITKSMTALALLQLHDAGRLDLERPGATRICRGSRSPRRQRPILVHELLSHTAGIPDDFAAEAGLRLRHRRAACAPRRSFRRERRGRIRTTATRRRARFSRGSTIAPWADALAARVFAPIGMDEQFGGLYARRDGGRRRRISVSRQRPAARRSILRWSRRRRSTSSIPPARCSRRPKTWRATCASISTAERPRAARSSFRRRRSRR